MILGLEIASLSGESEDVDSAIEYLLKNHQELEQVKVESSNCTDRVLQAVMTNPNILEIHFPRSCIIGENLQLDASMTLLNLKVLNLGECWRLTGKGLVNILSYTSDELKQLKLDGTGISLLEISSLTSIKNIEDLSVVCCPEITDKSLISFLNKTGDNSKSLNLRGTYRIALSEVDSLTTSLLNLGSLDLSFCLNVTDVGLISFLNKTGDNLKNLNLSDTYITLSEVGSLTICLPNLAKLDLSKSDVTDAGLISFLNKTGGNLNSLNLGETWIMLSDVGSLTRCLLNLGSLDLFGCRNFTDVGLISFLNKVGGNLKSLNLSRTNITLSEVGSLTTCLTNLGKLDLSESDVTDAGLISFLNKAGGSLKNVNLSNTNIKLSEAGSLTTCLPNLGSLDLFGCRVTDVGLIKLLEKTVKPLTLKLRNTGIPAANIKAQFPRITVIM